jgi:hypothetical protein
MSPAVLHADWHVTLMGRDQPVSSVFTSPGASNDVFCLPTAVVFRRVLSMYVPREGHEDPAVEYARHTGLR